MLKICFIFGSNEIVHPNPLKQKMKVNHFIISNTKNKLIIKSYEKLEVAPPHPDAEEEEVPR